MMAVLTTWELFIAALGGACFAIIFNIPKKFFVHATALAMLAKLGVVLLGAKGHLGFATFVSTFFVASISHLLARTTGKPAQAFLIPGVMFLVPGSSLYKSFSAALAADYELSMSLIVQAVVITASISFALLLANWVVPSRRTL